MLKVAQAQIGSIQSLSGLGLPKGGAVEIVLRRARRAGSISGDNFNAPLVPHNIFHPLQSTAPSGPWMFPARDMWQDDVSSHLCKYEHGHNAHTCTGLIKLHCGPRSLWDTSSQMAVSIICDRSLWLDTLLRKLGLLSFSW